MVCIILIIHPINIQNKLEILTNGLKSNYIFLCFVDYTFHNFKKRGERQT